MRERIKNAPETLKKCTPGMLKIGDRGRYKGVGRNAFPPFSWVTTFLYMHDVNNFKIK
jgi:hypothetical protein